MTRPDFAVIAVLLLSIGIQAWAAFTALRLIRITGRRTAWGLIAAALALMAVRRMVPLYRLAVGDASHPPDMMNELIGLVLSVCMAVGITRIAPLFLERKRAEEEQRRVSAEIEDLYDHAPCGYHSLDRAGVFLRMNDTELTWLGYSRDEVVGKKKFSDIVTAASLETFKANFPAFKERGWVKDLEFELVRKDGWSFPVLLSATAMYDETGAYVMSRSTVYDITERKRAEDELRRLNRELRAISDCNQILVRAENEQELLRDICRIICDEAGYRMAWVGYAEDDEARTIRPVAWAGVESGYIAAARLSWSERTERGKGPAGEAVRRGAGAYVQDIATDPLMGPWRQAALERGYRSGFALPLKDDRKKVFGVLLIYSAEAHAATPEEVKLMEDLAGDLAFGITALRARAERRRAREDSDKTHELLRATLEAAPIAVFDLDTEGHVKSIWNAAAEKLLGWRRDEVLGRFLPTVPEEGKAEFAAFRERMRAGKTILGKDLVRRRKDGSPIEYSLYAAPIYGPGGEVVGNIAALVDITERKKTEKALMASEERFRRLAENARDFIFRMSLPEGGYEYASPAVEALSGYTPEELYRSPQLIRNIVHPDWRSYLEEQWSRLLSGEMPPVYEFAIHTKTGEMRWVNQRNILVRDEAGRVIALEGIVTDVTDRKKAEEELRRMNEELEERVKKRTLELESKNKELDRMNKLFVNRELQMIELKQRVKKLERSPDEKAAAGAEGENGGAS